jgi:uncharacterized protein (TIGR02679 family)
MTADDRLQRLLGGERLAVLRKRLRRRFERGASEGAFRIGQLAPEEHAALAGLTGSRPRFSGSLQIDLPAVDAALRQAGIALSLRDALERLDGPIVDLAAREEVQTRWSQVASGRDHAGLRRMLQDPAAMGLLKRLSGGDPAAAEGICRQVEAVLGRLPAKGLPRARLAADVLGDAHALDTGRAVGTLVLAVCRTSDEALEAVVAAEGAREVWARMGVLVNELARPAMVLNLPGHGLAGEPDYLSLRRLLRRPLAWEVAGRTVFVCENPNLLAIAADALGSDCPPMVCTDGMPAAAQRALLTQLREAGARLLYHGDFDWAGVVIGNTMMREFGASAWRFGAGDYCDAVAVAPRPGHRLKGTHLVATWDDGLTAAMTEHQIAIPEEAVAAGLLQDLAVSK